MNRSHLLSTLSLVLLLFCRCQTAGGIEPAVAGSGTSRYLIDPRIGFTGTGSAALDKGIATAHRDFWIGNLPAAEKRYQGMARKQPAYLPAQLGLAAISLERGDAKRAESLIAQVLERQPVYLAAEIYRAEAAARAGDIDRAFALYQELAQRANVPPVARERFEDLSRQHFDSLFEAARREPSIERAIAYLREALTVLDAPAARLLLIQKLIELDKLDEARKLLDPILTDRQLEREVQEALVEIEAGKGRYNEAILRLERLARRYPSTDYRPRLALIKEKWNEANMPPQYHRAIAAGAITRTDFAVLVYWKLTAIRFAQNLAEPPIAIDVTDALGREELIRALALRLYQVDPLTRQVYPDRLVSGSTVMRIVSRLLLTGGATCATPVEESNELLRAQKVFDSCKLTKLDPDLPVSGRAAASLLEQVDRR